MNHKLRSTRYKNEDVDIAGQVVRFDGRGSCEGIVRHAGGLPYEQLKPINKTTLAEARKSPALYVVDDEKTPDKNEAHPRAKNKGALKKTSVKTKAVEVADSKAVIDVPIETQSAEGEVEPSPFRDDDAKLVDNVKPNKGEAPKDQ